MAPLIQDSLKQKKKKKKKKKLPKTLKSFLCCFGSPLKVEEKNSKKIRNGETLKVSWFSWSKKPPKIAFKAFDDATNEKIHRRKEGFRMPKLSKKFSTNKPQELPADQESAPPPPPSGIPVGAVGDQVVHGKANKTEDEKIQKINLLERSENSSHSDSISSKKRATCRRNSSSQPPTNSPVENPEAAALPHSATMPPPSAAGGGADGSSQGKEGKSHGKKEVCAGEFDQVVGMSIILATLLIMIAWGQFFAILCTSAWLYLYPLFTARISGERHKRKTRSGSKSLDLDKLDSQEHKQQSCF